jgi:hypothetical protein
MLNFPENITEAVDIIKHSLTDEQILKIYNLEKEKIQLLCVEIEKIISNEWGEKIYSKFINNCEIKNNQDVILYISKGVFKRINKFDSCIGKNMSSMISSAAQKDSVDSRLINACNKWIIISYSDYTWLSPDIPQCGTHLIGFVVNDHQGGLKALIHNWAIESNKRIILTRDIIFQDKVTWFLIANTIKKTFFEIIGEDNLNYLNLQNPQDYLSIYTNHKLKKVREVVHLDPLRHPDYPDDVIISLKYSDFVDMKIPLEIENLWGRLEEKLDENNFLCTLLNSPNFFPKIKTGNVVKIKYINDKDGPQLIIDLKPYFN